jgi:hypothetical protein
MCEPSLLEDVACDLAARGLVLGIEADDGRDMLGPTITELMQHTDSRASFAPRTATPSPVPALADALLAGEEPPAEEPNESDPRACASDVSAPLCESPLPSGAASLEDAVMREIATRSPDPAELVLPLERPVLVEPASLVKRTSPPPPFVADKSLDEPTPSHSQLLALAEPTIVDDVIYASEPSIPPVEEAPMGPSDPDRLAKTPLTSVKTYDEKAAGVPQKRKAWPMVAFVAATALVAWTVMHFSATGAGHAQKQPDPPAPVAPAPAPAAVGVDYTDVPADPSLPAGHGILEVSAPGDAIVLVDGVERGRGSAAVPLAPGAHGVRIQTLGGDDVRTVEVRSAKIARVKF